MPKPRITVDKIARSPEWEAELARQGLRPAPGTGRGAARLRGAALRRGEDPRYTDQRKDAR
ncbi:MULTISPECIES: hypothetical protein [Nocardiopsis]|uniref:Uncharacterized protein n=1 Tax=Nocardiopsis changdeensis TaxID=2831969 RepID=A0ABX8C1C1_9ACTN|nr:MULTISPECIES: hypothetical protein [Nocardiopsis]QUX26348.1 hypothetical protein KGD84_32120 [Nocardiopsis changdeensis]QYX40832.1 hypothetical protein K1J57_33055 [Nocardiopsis sp. MT53]